MPNNDDDDDVISVSRYCVRRADAGVSLMCIHSLSASFQTAFTDLEPVPHKVGTGVCLF